MASAEHNIESLVIAILQNSATFSGVSIEHHVEDADTVEKGSRLTVKCEPKTPLVDGRSLSAPVGVWQAQVSIEVVGSVTETVFDNWRAAIDTEIGATSYPASVVTSATALFASGIIIDQPTGGTIFGGPAKRRNLVRNVRVVFRT